MSDYNKNDKLINNNIHNIDFLFQRYNNLINAIEIETKLSQRVKLISK